MLRTQSILVWLLMCASQPTLAGHTLYEGARTYQGWGSTYHRPTPAPSPVSCPKYCLEIEQAGKRHKLPPELIIEVIRRESQFNPLAVSPKGAKGLMQLMDVHTKNHIDPFHPGQNINKGSQHLSRLLKRYDTVELALAAYNAGEGNVSKYGGIPPFKETQQYVKSICSCLKHSPTPCSNTH